MKKALRAISQESALFNASFLYLANQWGGLSERNEDLGIQIYATIAQNESLRDAALNNWGNALQGQAKTKVGEESDRLFEASYEKYARALELKPDDYNVFNNWGCAFLVQTKTKKEDEKSDLLERAEHLFLKAEKLLIGSASYNLACLAAIRSDAADTIRWLSSCPASKDLSQSKIASDDDFELVRLDPSFQNFVKKLP